MAAQIHLKTGLQYIVDAYREDIVREWDKVLGNQTHEMTRTYPVFNRGLPLPQVTIDMRDITAVEESKR